MHFNINIIINFMIIINHFVLIFMILVVLSLYLNYYLISYHEQVLHWNHNHNLIFNY